MQAKSPDFIAVSSLEEQLLYQKLDTVRLVLSHAGEKGRSLEAEARDFLRDVLPAEYGLTTGFIAYHGENGPLLTSQLDLVIFDNVRCGPIARLGSCDVIPIESAYGYIEVKASLRSTSDGASELADNSIEQCIETNQVLRKIKVRKFWVPGVGSVTSAGVVCDDSFPSLRSYVLAFSAEGEIARTPQLMAQRIANFCKRVGQPVHLHGVFVAGSAFYSTIPLSDNEIHKNDLTHAFRVRYVSSDALAAFKWTLLHDLARFPRFPSYWTPALDQYRKTTVWTVREPEH
jgi:hypothetical protein